MNKRKGLCFVLSGVLLASVALLGFSGPAVAEAWRDIYSNNLFAHYLFTGNIIAPLLNLTGGSGSIPSGGQWIPSLNLISSRGSAIFGPLTLYNNSGQGPGVKIEDCTGSAPVSNTIGIDVVADLAANATVGLPQAAITATGRRTSSAASAGSRSS